MNEPTMETLARRLDRVERENRRLKRAGVVALAVIGAVVLMGQATGSKVVEAENFTVRDASGRVRAELRMESLTGGWSPRLKFYDDDGKLRAVLGLVGNDATELRFFKRNGKQRAGLSVWESKQHGGDWSRLVFFDRNGNPRIDLGVQDDNPPYLLLRDTAQRTRTVLGGVSLETAQTGVVERRPESSLVLFGKDGKTIWSAP
ncbi:MAG: hypothetical protein ACE5JU_20435 [Candidatus Binatia bacterium]